MFLYSINPHNQLENYSSTFPTYSHSNIIWLHTDLKRHCWTSRICHSYHCYSLGNCLILCWCEIHFPIKHEHSGTWKITLGLLSNPGLITSLNFNQTKINSWTGNKPELPTDCSQLRQPASRHPAWNNILFRSAFRDCTNLDLFCVPLTWMAAWGTFICSVNHSGNYTYHATLKNSAFFLRHLFACSIQF